MTIRVFNSLTKQKEIFEPLSQKMVKFYTCGPTVYDEPHIGHLRSSFIFEMIRNILEYAGYTVSFVRNVTDIDDKIIEKAKGLGPEVGSLIEATKAVSQKYYLRFIEDLKRIGLFTRESDREPFCTAHIPEMIALVQKLITSGHAYAVEGDVYFSVDACPNYGKLSHQKKDSLLENVRIEKSDKKKSSLDFALWKLAKEGEPAWDSPWGKGRPGWHIECSAMSQKYLGDTFDIHGGGRDLIFPHHENEIAQSESVTGKPLAKYWIHHGLVTIDKQKMSKSDGNTITLDGIAKQRGPEGPWAEELKLLFMSTHYSAPLDNSSEKMDSMGAIWKRFYYFFEHAS